MTTPHPHADMLHAIADGKQMQGRLKEDGCDWFDIDPDQAIGAIASGYSMKVRIKHETVLINGIKCPAPMTEAPEGGYWIPIIDSDSASKEFWWRADHSDFLWLERGLCFATEADAKAVAEAMLAPLRGYMELAMIAPLKGGAE